MKRFKKYWFWGGILDINRTNAKETSDYFLNDEFVQRFGRISKNAGVGLTIQYDSRDLIVNAYEGTFLDLSFTTYGRFLGGVNRYEVVSLDYRQYEKLASRRSVLPGN